MSPPVAGAMMSTNEHYVQRPVFGALRWLAMAEERYDALLQYVNDWGRREPEAHGDTPPEERPRQEDKAPPVEWPFLDLESVFLELTQGSDPRLVTAALQEAQCAVLDWQSTDLSEALLEVQRAFDPMLLAEALQRAAEPAAQRLYERVNASGGVENSKIRLGGMLRRLAMDSIGECFERRSLPLGEIIDVTHVANHSAEPSPSIAYHDYGCFPAEDVRLFVGVHRYGLGVDALQVLGRSAWGEAFALTGMWEQEFRDRSLRLLIAERAPQRREVFPLQDAAWAIHEFFTIVRADYPGLGACRAPRDAKQPGGGGTCDTVFVDRSRGCHRFVCSARCKSRLKRWRKKHGRSVYELPNEAAP